MAGKWIVAISSGLVPLIVNMLAYQTRVAGDDAGGAAMGNLVWHPVGQL